MARCSCAGNSCSCSVTAGAGIVVEGTGSNTAPFVISVAPTPSSVDFTTGGVLDLGSLTPAAVARIVLKASATDVTLPTNGTKLDLMIVQDGVGGRTINWPDLIEWPGGTEPVVTATPNAGDWITLIQAGGVWSGVRIGVNLT